MKFVIALLFFFQATITPAFQQSRVEKALNFLRDDIVDASNAPNPIVTRQVVSYVLNWHRQVVLTTKVGTSGWQAIISNQVEALSASLNPADKALIQPDVDFIKALLK